jgi:hypothetical protein
MSGLGLLLAAVLSLQQDAAADDASEATTDAGVVETPDARADRPPTADAGLPTATASAVGPKGTPPLPHAPLAGRVLEKGTRRPVAGALVTVDQGAGSETDADGRFAVDVPCGVRAIAVQAPELEPLLVAHDPCADPSPLLLRLVRNQGGRTFKTTVRAPSSLPSVNVQGPELVKTPGSLGDPFRVIESLPGVTSVLLPAPLFVVRGANPGNTGFFLDDLRVPALFHLALGPSVIHPYFFDSIDFYPGGYPARYGRYVAGIVTAQTRAAPSDMVHASVDVRLFDAGALVTGPLPDGQGSVEVAARYSYTGEAVSLLSNAVQLQYWDYQLRADRDFGPVHLTLLAFGSSDFLSSTSPTATQTQLALRFNRISLRAKTPAAGGVVTGSVALGTDHTQAPLEEEYPLTIDSLSVFPRLSFRRPMGRVALEVGFDGQLQHFDALTPVQRPMVLDLARVRDARLMGTYASLVVNAGNRLVLTPELRLDSYEVSGVEKADLGPRLSARLALGDGSWITAAGGRFTQTPSLPLQLPGAESFGLALYGLQTSWQGSLGVGTKRAHGFELDLTGYVQRYVLTDLRDPSITTNIDPLADDFLVRRDALSYGLEVLVRRAQTERLYGWLSYTLSQNLRAFGGGVIGPSDWDQRHIVNLVVGYRIGPYTVGGRAHFNTGRPVLVGGSFVRLPPYYQIDLRADRRYVFKSFALEVYAELLNSTLSTEVISLSPTANGQTVENGYRIVLPSIGVHGEL